MPKLSRPLHRIHLQLDAEDYQWLLETVGPYKIGVTVRALVHEFIRKHRDQERKEIDRDNTNHPAPP